MKIQFNDGKVGSLHISRTGSSDKAESDIENFEIQSGFPSEYPKVYLILFKLSLRTPCGALVDLEYEATFETDEEINDDFKSSQFILVNSPAIAYPYLRAYVSALLTLSGYDNVILPTMNFQAMYNQSQADKDSE